MKPEHKSNAFIMMLAIGLLQIAAYMFSGFIACDDGVLAVPQPDAPLYYQAARRIVEGHPFSYSEGSAPCAGTTSILHPFLLAIPYAFGATGDSLHLASFVVNALCYLMFLWGWSVALRNWCQNPPSVILASVLVALSGHCACVTFAQSDIGFLLAYTALLAAALSADRRWIIGLLLVLGPWVRPEGMICVIAYCLITWVYLVMQRYLSDLREKNTFPCFVICALSAISCVGVFVLNYALTGHAQFSSVAGKGHFVQHGFAMAVYRTTTDFITMIKELLFGLAKGYPRSFVSLPGLGIVLLAIGVTVYRWNERKVRGLFVLILAALGGLVSVAQSGWQDTNFDRYVVWTFPIAILFVAEAVSFVECRYMPIHLRKLPSSFVVMMALIGAVALPFVFNETSRITDSTRLFARDCDKIMEPSASFGGHDVGEIAYYCSPRRFGHFSGIYSQEFSPKSLTENVERLRHCPETRFEYWIFSSELISFWGKTCASKIGEVLLSGPDGLSLVKADWSPFDIPDASKHNDLSLVANIEVGYEADEKAVDYYVITRWGLEVFDPFVKSGYLRDKFIVDVGRAILGGDEMSVPLKPGVDATVVMRTCPSHVVMRKTGLPSEPIDCAFANPIRFNISVDGNVVRTAEVSYSTNSFSDVSFRIPGASIKNPISRVGFLGDHITFGYWFYQ